MKQFFYYLETDGKNRLANICMLQSYESVEYLIQQ